MMIYVIAGVVLGLIFGIINAIGFTFFYIAQSNSVGKYSGTPDNFRSESEVVYHTKLNYKRVNGRWIQV